MYNTKAVPAKGRISKFFYRRTAERKSSEKADKYYQSSPAEGS